MKHFHPRIKNSLFFSFMWNCRIIRRFIPPKKNWEMMFSSEYSTMLFLIERLFCSAVSQTSKLMKQTNKSCRSRFNGISFHWTLCVQHIPKIQQRMSILLKHKVESRAHCMTPTLTMHYIRGHPLKLPYFLSV